MALMSFTSLYVPSTGTYTQAYRDKYFQTCLYTVVIWTAFPIWGVVACSDAGKCLEEMCPPESGALWSWGYLQPPRELCK